MARISRRNFLLQSGTAITAGCLLSGTGLSFFNSPIGLQLYTVGDLLKKDFEGTLEQVAAIGYREVEMAGFFGKTPGQVKAALKNAGLHCGSAHIFGPLNFEETLDYVKELGAKYVITSGVSPQRVIEARKDPKASEAMKDIILDDCKELAEVYNKMGEQASRVGIQLAYHNHNWEFQSFNGVIFYDELLLRTDPELVKFELDCGWAKVAGHDPVTYLEKYAGRFRLLHIKDFEAGYKPTTSRKGDTKPPSTELGRGGIDYKPILLAAKKTAVDWLYVEQEPPFTELPALEAIKVSYDYLKHLNL
jgi:sugar phosphate isomerase/epimerase